MTIDCARLENGRWVRHRSVGAANTDPGGEVEQHVTPFRATVALPLTCVPQLIALLGHVRG